MNTYLAPTTTKRASDCTVIVGYKLVAKDARVLPNVSHFTPCDPSELAGLDYLWRQAGVEYYGRL